MIQRPYYLEWLTRWKDKDAIKVIAGMRRSGKSTIMELFQAELIGSGVDERHIIALNFESFEPHIPRDTTSVYDFLVSKASPIHKTYVFLDEIQLIENFEKLVDALHVRKDIDLYITGSNAYFLSSDLATLLTGRYVQITVHPLSFAEYASVDSALPLEQRFERYLTYGGLPYASLLTDERTVTEYLDGVFSSIIVKDIASRRPRMNMRSFQATAAFLADNVGNISSLKRIAEGLTLNNNSISEGAVAEYVESLLETYLLYKVERFDLKGKEYLKTLEKYYLGDLGFRYWLLGKRGGDVGRRIENVVYLELKRRYTTVDIGKIGSAEVDFVASDSDGLHYFQVAQTVLDEATLQRELAPFEKIKDNHPKTLLTLDAIGLGDFNGVAHVNVIDWLLA